MRGLVHDMEHAWRHAPNAFDENPVEAFRRSIYVHPFHEENPLALIELLGADRVLFGSDYPHPEGMSTRSASSTSWKGAAGGHRKGHGATSTACSG